jgi:hypothetical protein
MMRSSRSVTNRRSAVAGDVARRPPPISTLSVARRVLVDAVDPAIAGGRQFAERPGGAPSRTFQDVRLSAELARRQVSGAGGLAWLAEVQVAELVSDDPPCRVRVRF